MAGNTGRTNSAQSGKSKTKMIIFAVEVLLILVMLAVLYFVLANGKEGPKINDLSELTPEELGINDKVLADKEQQVNKVENTTASEGLAKTGYLNIALFGVDATTKNEIYKGSRSDTIMIASINMETGDIRLVSVYRDTYMNLGTDTYHKCNHAYAGNGAEQAVKMLNMNLDMDITNFITVGYPSLMDVVDGLGGIYLDVDATELKHINNYQESIVRDLKYLNLSGFTRVEETGYQKLNGLQVAAYCRIRYRDGDDFARAESQREVVKALEEKAKHTDPVTLTKVFNNVIGDVYTSLDSKDLLDFVSNINNYRIVEEGGFPTESMRTTANIGAKGSCVIPLDLEKNVVWLHQFLFEDGNYTVSETVKECSKKVASDTAAYLKK